MVEIRHCDRCGNRLPINQPLDEPCGKCGHVQQEEPAAAGGTRAHPPSGGTAARQDSARTRETRRAPAATGSNVTVFAVAAVSGTLVAVAVGLLLMGESETSAPVPVGSPAPAPVGEAAAPVPEAPPRPEPEAAPAPVPGTVPPPAPPKDDGDEEDDFFAKLRAESESRRVKIAEAQAEKRRPFEERVKRAVSRWDPAWRVVNSGGDDPNTPMVNPCDYLDRKNVLVTHPFNRETPCTLERTVDVPAGGRTELVVTVAPCDRDAVADWELRVLVDGERVGTRAVGPGGGGAAWHTFRFDLGRFAGRNVTLRLEHASGGPRNPWNWEHAYWAEARVVTE
ncbi:MAG: hypothetical protein ACYS9X_21620 [Planctomycetota bacterium]|jgi:hypothetical protein